MKRRHVARAVMQLVLLAAALPAGAQEAVPAATWPRVFYTPEERRQVTLQRRAALEGGVSVASHDEQAGSTVANTHLAAPRVDGISLVRGARFAAWIGGRRIEDGAQYEGYRLRITRDGVQLVDAAGIGRLVKVGQPVHRAGRATP